MSDAENAGVTPAIETPPTPGRKMIPEEEVGKMIQERTARERETTRLKHEENERLKKQIQELQSKLEKGIATPEDVTKLQAAEQGAQQGAQQGMSQAELERYVEMRLKTQELANKIDEAAKKDAEFKKLMGETDLYAEEVASTAYLPNSVAVVKYLMKNEKAKKTLRAALERDPTGTRAMEILNNYSDLVDGQSQKPKPSDYQPAPELADEGDTDQQFDVSRYISDRY